MRVGRYDLHTAILAVAPVCRLESSSRLFGEGQDLCTAPIFAPQSWIISGSTMMVLPSSLEEKIKYDGKLLTIRQINGCVNTVSCVPLDGATNGLKNSLMLQVNNLSSSSIIREELLATEFTMISNSGIMNEGGDKIVIGKNEGFIILLEKPSNSHDIFCSATGDKWKSTVLPGHEGTVMSVAISSIGGALYRDQTTKQYAYWTWAAPDGQGRVEVNGASWP